MCNINNINNPQQLKFIYLLDSYQYHLENDPNFTSNQLNVPSTGYNTFNGNNSHINKRKFVINPNLIENNNDNGMIISKLLFVIRIIIC